MRNLYLQSMNEKGFEGILVEYVGLLISRKNSFLGALLDDIVKCNQDTWGLEKSAHLQNIIPPCR